MRPPNLVRTLIALSLLGSATPVAAQRYSDLDDGRWLDNCRDNGYYGDRDDRGRACEVRNVPVRMSGRALDIDGRQNGSIRVIAWDGDSLRVTARMQAQARSDEDAASLLKEIKFSVDGRRIRAEGPHHTYGRESWSVSYVVYVPRRFDLNLEAHNGSISVTGVTGRMDLDTQNGSVNLTDAGGEVHARTQNGSVNVQLAGTKWDGSGLDAETQNGSVRLAIPERYAALVETGTVNGRVNTDFPITVQGRISHRFTLPLNGGGPPIRAMTTNGSVTLSRR